MELGTGQAQRKCSCIACILLPSCKGLLGRRVWQYGKSRARIAKLLVAEAESSTSELAMDVLRGGAKEVSLKDEYVYKVQTTQYDVYPKASKD